MLRIAGQTAGPNWAELFHGHSWVAGGCYRLKKFIVFIIIKQRIRLYIYCL